MLPPIVQVPRAPRSIPHRNPPRRRRPGPPGAACRRARWLAAPARLHSTPLMRSSEKGHLGVERMRAAGEGGHAALVTTGWPCAWQIRRASNLLGRARQARARDGAVGASPLASARARSGTSAPTRMRSARAPRRGRRRRRSSRTLPVGARERLDTLRGSPFTTAMSIGRHHHAIIPPSGAHAPLPDSGEMPQGVPASRAHAFHTASEPSSGRLAQGTAPITERVSVPMRTMSTPGVAAISAASRGRAGSSIITTTTDTRARRRHIGRRKSARRPHAPARSARRAAEPREAHRRRPPRRSRRRGTSPLPARRRRAWPNLAGACCRPRARENRESPAGRRRARLRGRPRSKSRAEVDHDGVRPVAAPLDHGDRPPSPAGHGELSPLSSRVRRVDRAGSNMMLLRERGRHGWPTPKTSRWPPRLRRHLRLARGEERLLARR